MKYLLLFVPILLAACASKPVVNRDELGNEIPEPFEIVEGAPTYTDIARFLGGRPVRYGANLSRMQQTADYKMYSQDTLQKWNLRTKNRVAAQNQWQAFNIRPQIGAPRTVVYPFGGPDLLYAMSMFPASSQYVLLGLEPVGNVPDLENTAPETVFSSLPRHAAAIKTQLLYGYFITKDMKTDFSNGALQGVVPVMLSALGLMEATVTDVQAINAGGNPGVQIDFVLPGRGRKSVVYVSGDLSNRGFPGAYESWLTSTAKGSVAYFKAASYLMQDSAFSGVRGWVLAHSNGVVQDDSGIPYKAFDPQVWDIRLFGGYTAPISFFSNHRQPDLAAAYAAAGELPGIPFGSGYQMKGSDANLMVVSRR